MKVFYLIYFLLAAAATVTANSNEDVHQHQQQLEKFTGHVKHIQDYCLIKENVTNSGGSSEEEEEEISDKIHEWHCFLECVASEMGIVSFFLF